MSQRPADSQTVEAPVNALSMSAWILLVNIGVYLLGHFIFPPKLAMIGDTIIDRIASPIDSALLFSYRAAVQQFEVWRFLTFQFVHANLTHIGGNMLALMTLGPAVEEYLGRRRFLAFYLICGVMGPLAFLILMAVAGPTVYSADSSLVGASAGVFGILVGAAMVAPRDWVQLIFPPTPVRLRTVAILMLLVAVYTVFAHGRSANFNAGGEAAHLGGAVMGYFLIRHPELLDWAERFGPKRRPHRI
jgi:membrane associated rhomboid family serine protease